MKKLLVILSFFSALSAAITWFIDSHYPPYLLQQLPVYVVNNQERPLLLYDANNIQGPAISLLLPNDGFRLYYAGDTGQWLYGWKNNRSVFLKSEQRLVAFVINGQLFSVTRSWQFLSALTTFLVFLMLSYKGFAKKPNAYRTSTRPPSRRVYPTIEEKKPQSSNNHENTWLRQENYRLTQKLKIMHEEFLHKEQRFNEAIQNTEVRRDVTVPDMQQEYDALEKQYAELIAQYQQLKSDSKVFDIDFDSSSYKNILNGRKFEIFLAKKLSENKAHQILEWTSDKGFDSSIRVKSNGNPDLVVQYGGKYQLAIECKFRSKNFWYINGKKTDRISWSSVYAADRYSAFATERNMPIFVALGWKGQPKSPKRLFLIPLSRLISLSTQDWFDPRDTGNPYKAQYTVEYSKLHPFDATQSVQQAIKAIMIVPPDESPF